MYANFNLNRELENKLMYGKVSSPQFPIHFHSQIEIYHVRSGKIETVVNNERKVLCKGEISFASSFAPHGYRTIDESTVDSMIVPLSCCEEFIPLLNDRQAAFPFLSDRKVSQTVAEAFEALYKVKSNELLERGYVYVILGAILDNLTPQKSEPAHAVQIDIPAKLLIYVSNHFREKLTLVDVAREFGYNPSYLSRSFQGMFGISFVSYLTMLRLREALVLLRDKSKSITECVFESGFGSMRSFYRAFHNEFGCTPKKYLLSEHDDE